MLGNMNVPEPGKHLQRERRVSRHFTDQHGIQYYAEADLESQQPIGELQPVGRRLPWQPPMRFAKFAKKGDLHFSWDYQAMADECATLVAKYYEDAIEYAQDKNLPVPDVGGKVDHRIRAKLGVPPLSPEIPLSALAGDKWLLGVPGAPVNEDLDAHLIQVYGSRTNEALATIKERIQKRVALQNAASGTTASMIPEGGYEVKTTEAVTTEPVAATYQDFVKEGRANGMTMPEISLAWSEHKKHLAAELGAAA